MRFADRAEPFRNAAGEIDWLAYATAQSVSGFIHPSEAALLVELATSKDYMEVGAFKGFSAWCVAHVATSVLSIDTFKACDNGQDQQDAFTTLAEYDRVTGEFRAFPNDVVTRLPYSSERAYELIPESAAWDVVFIDAMHTYEGVLEDIKRWWPRVRPGGVLCLHDYGHDAFPGVKQAADEVFGEPSEPWVVTLRVVRKPLGGGV
jgi:predicted O-methyltransferase YrrM